MPPTPPNAPQKTIADIVQIRGQRVSLGVPSKAPVPFEKKIGKVRIALTIAIGIAVCIIVALCFAPIEDYYTAEGRVLPGDDRKLYAGLRARVAEAAVREGEAVKAGQILLRFDLRDLDLEIEEAEAQLEKLMADLKYQRAGNEALARLPLPSEFWEVKQQVAKSDAALQFQNVNLKRLESLSGSGAASQQQIDLAKLEVEQARIELDRWKTRLALVEGGYGDVLLAKAKTEEDRIEVQIDSLERKLRRLNEDLVEHSVVIAPKDGVILKMFHDDPGEIVEAGQLLVYMEVGTDRVVEINGGQRNFHKVQVGQTVRFKSSLYDPLKFGYAEGNVSRIDPVREIGQTDQSVLDAGFYPIYAPITKTPVDLKLDSTVTARIILRRDRLIKVLFERD
jgi:multidrug resistance efflux pump